MTLDIECLLKEYLSTEPEYTKEDIDEMVKTCKIEIMSDGFKITYSNGVHEMVKLETKLHLVQINK